MYVRIPPRSAEVGGAGEPRRDDHEDREQDGQRQSAAGCSGSRFKAQGVAQVCTHALTVPGGAGADHSISGRVSGGDPLE
jgi:hypothetical protein